MNYKIIDHTADLAVEFYGKSVTELFENSAVSLSEIIYDQKAENGNVHFIDIEVTNNSLEINYIDFIREILYQINQNYYYFYSCKTTFISETALSIKCFYSQLKKDEVKNEIKAVTYHECSINNKLITTQKIYFAKVTFDI
jgi:SHS2 domain-containing protein